MTPTIYDVRGIERNMAWLRSKYGNVVFLDAGEGRKFALVRVDETAGLPLIKVRVIDEEGRPRAGAHVANRWPDPSLPDQTRSGAQTLWRPQALAQQTDSNGLSGFSLGPGSYIANLQEGGPHTVWVLSPSMPSDGLAGVGMLGGTNHEGPLFLTFQVRDESQPPAPPPLPPEPTPPEDPVLQRLDEVMEKLDEMQVDLRQLLRHFGAG